jgi:predicted permease
MHRMAHSLLQVALFLFLIALAHMLKRIGLFTEREGATLSKITLNITLPAAIVASFNTFKLDYSLLVLIFYGTWPIVMMTLSISA